jgi:hypothetical protein
VALTTKTGDSLMGTKRHKINRKANQSTKKTKAQKTCLQGIISRTKKQVINGIEQRGHGECPVKGVSLVKE